MPVTFHGNRAIETGDWSTAFAQQHSHSDPSIERFQQIKDPFAEMLDGLTCLLYTSDAADE